MWAWFWAAWALVGAVGEAVALRTPRGTLSHQVRSIVRRHPALRWGSLVGWLGFTAWFAKHIWG